MTLFVVFLKAFSQNPKFEIQENSSRCKRAMNGMLARANAALRSALCCGGAGCSLYVLYIQDVFGGGYQKENFCGDSLRFVARIAEKVTAPRTQNI